MSPKGPAHPKALLTNGRKKIKTLGRFVRARLRRKKKMRAAIR